jgi:hypothetical protein
VSLKRSFAMSSGICAQCGDVVNGYCFNCMGFVEESGEPSFSPDSSLRHADDEPDGYELDEDWPEVEDLGDEDLEDDEDNDEDDEIEDEDWCGADDDEGCCEGDEDDDVSHGCCDGDEGDDDEGDYDEGDYDEASHDEDDYDDEGYGGDEGDD